MQHSNNIDLNSPQQNLTLLDCHCWEVFERRKSELLSLRTKVKRERSQPEAQLRGRRKSHEPELPHPDLAYVQHLRHLCRFLPADWQWGHYLCIDLALLHIGYADNQFEQVHNAIRLMVKTLPVSMEAEVEELWYNAAYRRPCLAGAGSRRNGRWRPAELMTPVNRYRVRKRCPCPTTDRCGVKKYKVSQATKELLMGTFRANPRPSREEKEQLSLVTGLSSETVSNWFKNRRQRTKMEPKVADCEPIYDPPTSCELTTSPASDSSSGYASAGSQFTFTDCSPHSITCCNQFQPEEPQNGSLYPEEVIIETDLAQRAPPTVYNSQYHVMPDQDFMLSNPTLMPTINLELEDSYLGGNYYF